MTTDTRTLGDYIAEVLDDPGGTVEELDPGVFTYTPGPNVGAQIALRFTRADNPRVSKTVRLPVVMVATTTTTTASQMGQAQPEVTATVVVDDTQRPVDDAENANVDTDVEERVEEEVSGDTATPSSSATAGWSTYSDDEDDDWDGGSDRGQARPG